MVEYNFSRTELFIWLEILGKLKRFIANKFCVSNKITALLINFCVDEYFKREDKYYFSDLFNFN